MFTTKNISLAACITTALLNPFTLFSNTHIAVISGNKVVMESAKGKALDKELKRLQESFMAPIQKIHSEIEKGEKDFKGLQEKGQKIVSELQSGDKMLSAAAKQSKEEALRKLEEEAKDMATDLQRLAEKRNNAIKTAEEKMKMKYNEKMQPFNDEIQNTVKVVATEQKKEIVLMKEQCVYVANSVDITDLVIAALDEDYNKEKAKENAEKAKTTNDKK